MRSMKSSSGLALTAAALLMYTTLACTNLLITPEASEDGSSMVYYSADSAALYAKIEFFARAQHEEGSTLAIHDWDSGKYLGEIAQVNHTLNVVANQNEKQVIIGETTFGGLEDLCEQPGAIMDYGSLIWVTLQRAETARDAIRIMGELVAEYGYASEGESFSIADTKEVWVLEMISKGEHERGAVWVAQRVPAGHIVSHANQARIRTFPLNDNDNAIYSKDVISFARKLGLYEGADEAFSFSDTYDPVTPSGARLSEARVWSLYRQFSDDMMPYLDYVQGRNLTNRMPWSIVPNAKLSLNRTIWATRQHNEHSWFDNTQDEGAEAFGSPYRWRPLSWEVDGAMYVNERTVAAQQTGWNFVAQARSWLPDAVGAITWFGADDAATSVHVPVYASMTRVPSKWAHPEGDHTVSGDVTKFSFDSAFWVTNMVANLAYTRWEDVFPHVAEEIAATEAEYFETSAAAEEKALALLANGQHEAAVDLLTDYSVENANECVTRFLGLWQRLFVMFRDGSVTKADENNPSCGCKVDSTGYPKKWYKRIVEDTGDHYLMNNEPGPDLTASRKLRAKNKLLVRGV